MPRDYAKSSMPNRRGGIGKKKPSTPIWLWVVTIVIVILFIAGAAYLRKHKWPFELHKKTLPVQKTVKVKTPPPTTASAPRFEFYDMLSNTKASAPIESTTVINNKPSAVTPIAPTKSEVPVVTAKPTVTLIKPIASAAKPAPAPKTSGYILQIGSFKETKPAEQLKAKLSLQGIETTVLKLSASKQNWYRVIAGPYTSAATAEKIKAKLQAAGYKPILHNQTK